LERFGYLHRDDSGEFRLGPALWRLGVLYQASFNLADYVRPVLANLVEATEETACFYVRERGKRICLYRLNAPRMVRSHLDEGAELPLDRGAAGHVLLAFSGKVGEQYDKVREAGFYVSKGERDPESTAVAIPVFRSGRQLAGALGVVGPRARMTAEACVRARKELEREATTLSAKLGAR
jgi:DNA-binding IclR family transcriptional regulator